MLGVGPRHEPARYRGGTGSEPLPGTAPQAAHNRQGARYRLGLPRHRHQPALHRQYERLWG